MADNRGYYIAEMRVGERGVEVGLVYGEPSTGRRALASSVERIERAFVVGKYADVRGMVFVSRAPVNEGMFSHISARENGFALDLEFEPALQKLFDFYLLEWLSKKIQYSTDNGIRSGIARVLGIGPSDKDRVKEFLDIDEPVHIEVPKVRVEGLEGILEKAQSFEPDMAPVERD
jgi:hypothetical protein